MTHLQVSLNIQVNAKGLYDEGTFYVSKCLFFGTNQLKLFY